MIYYPDIKKRVYYSQNREDLILEAFFPDIDEGFYVDVGAYDPDSDSVTKLFYEKGWRGINIEPQPDRIEFFYNKRKRDINLNIGISDKTGEMKLRSFENQGLSTFSEEIKNTYQETKDNKDTKKFKDISVSIETLAKVFRDNKVDKIHFLKIDVEGLEYEVLKGNDWNKFRPEVLCIESNHVVHNWHPLIIKNNYSLAFNDGLNNYYVDNKTKRIEKFNYVDNLLLKKGVGIAFEDYRHIESLRSNYESTLNDATSKQKTIESMQVLINDKDTSINIVIAEQSSIKRTLRRLIINFIRIFKK